MVFEFEVQGGDFATAGNASSQIKKILKQLNVDHRDIKRIVVALYEAEVNIVAHAFKGRIIANIDTSEVRIRLVDEGPGIPDIELAMQQGYSTASSEVREMGFGAGMGLPNMKKNTDEMHVTSVVDKGTTVELIVFINQPTT
ncbi:MAG TPA: anti-sigma regulatory factor [Bacteroidales bacterium]|nr:MAG: anti-sigma regulatory factor [Bacteroidetes bacterium GWE2_42_24]OFY25697.1 MAG: anti-sigma regulatory factor [Bacteroidetes bacterium GWF2_43_11]HAQ64617.1 anti-sigma regulatory factor [Bacteroidales bacterium]HBZ68041.1 anti-sigma regulatory factor [Bacteroidales bacterium]